MCGHPFGKTVFIFATKAFDYFSGQFVLESFEDSVAVQSLAQGFSDFFPHQRSHRIANHPPHRPNHNEEQERPRGPARRMIDHVIEGIVEEAREDSCASNKASKLHKRWKPFIFHHVPSAPTSIWKPKKATRNLIRWCS